MKGSLIEPFLKYLSRLKPIRHDASLPSRPGGRTRGLTKLHSASSFQWQTRSLSQVERQTVLGSFSCVVNQLRVLSILFTVKAKQKTKNNQFSYSWQVSVEKKRFMSIKGITKVSCMLRKDAGLVCLCCGST